MLSQIFMHTPKWVYVLFATLLWLGARQLFAHGLSLFRVTLLPVVMTGLSIFGVASAFGDSPSALLAWAAAALVLLAFVLRRPVPRGIRYEPGSRRFAMPGSAVPLVLMMGIFFTKYGVGVLLALHPQLARQAAFAIGISAFYGTFTGLFAGRALRLWKLAIAADRRGSAQAAPAIDALQA
ncbi:hypothetical protein QTH87_05415 [Variovorax sp. J22P168]|nr:DUF6622 family protein [Variovorax sp. J22P168]MDM0011874.1 hypothetical protein [Variovorax sp. J22P168]